MKKIVIIMIILILLFVGIFTGVKLYECYRIKNAVILVELVDDLDVEFNSKTYLSNIIKSINGEYKDFEIDTTKLGEKTIKFDYINDEKIKVSYEFKINIKDTVPPFVNLSNRYSVILGSEDTLLRDIMCGDNEDDNPKCEIEGEYDLNKIGTYPLTFRASDKSGNETIKNFDLIVKEKSKPIYSNDYTDFKYIYDNYKTENTRIGLDISKYQDDVDFSKVKSAGVSFIMIRVGTKNFETKEYVLDPKFKQNIEGAIKEGIDIGIYFYSYASSKKEAKDDANWVIEQIKDYKISMPIAYDWEDWSDYNSYNLSFYKLNQIAKTYLDTIKDNGYDPILYGSKFYLQNIWDNEYYDTWLAHYINETNYEGNYTMWQLCDNGKIDGINGYVDIDIYYTENY